MLGTSMKTVKFTVFGKLIVICDNQFLTKNHHTCYLFIYMFWRKGSEFKKFELGSTFRLLFYLL